MKTATATATLLCLSALSGMANAAGEFSVTVYEGPTECEDENKVKVGNYLRMHYVATIDESSEVGEKGHKFDSSLDRGPTFDFKIGDGFVIKGWDEGLIGLCKGAKAKMVVPPDWGYGEHGSGEAVPPGATLNFDVEVMDVLDEEPEPPNLFKMLDEDGDGKISREEMTAYFTRQGGKELPEGLFEHEDQNGDGFVTWEEFSGPKGNSPPVHDEL